MGDPAGGAAVRSSARRTEEGLCGTVRIRWLR